MAFRYSSAIADVILILIVVLSSLGVDGYFYSSEDGDQKWQGLEGDQEHWLVKRINRISCHCCANSFNSHCCIQCMQRTGKRSDQNKRPRYNSLENIADVLNKENILLEETIPKGRAYRLVKQVNHLFQLSPPDW